MSRHDGSDTWEWDVFRPAGKHGSMVPRIALIYRDIFAVHPSIVTDDGKLPAQKQQGPHSVSHVPTGMCIVKFQDIHRALKFAERAYRLPIGWSAGEIGKPSAEMKSKTVGAAVQSLYDEICKGGRDV